MNINDYRKAMDHVVPNSELKERIMRPKTSPKHTVPVRRILVCALTSVLMLACITSVALAAGPKLYAAVLSFFHIEEREQVPGQTDVERSGVRPADADRTDTGQPNISRAEIGGLVRAQYIEQDQNYGLSGGLLNHLTWSEDRRTLLEARFWEIRDNSLIPVQVDMRTTRVDVTFHDIRYQGSLYWFTRNGELYLFQGVPYGVDTRPEDEWYVNTVPGHTDAVLLKLAQGQQMTYTEYPMLFYPESGEAEDFLTDTGADQLEYAYDYLWSEDLRRVLILCGMGEDEQEEWLCDLDAGTLTRIEDLTGMAGGVSAGFADNDTLILTVHTESEEDGTWRSVACYAYDIPTGQMTKTLEETHYYRWWDEPYGAQLFGRRCVLVDRDGQVRLVDLKMGTQAVIEGFAYGEGDHFLPSPSGNKLLYYASDPEADGLGITRLGVVDLEKGTFIAFDREGCENLYEEGIGWSDDSTVSINARSFDAETRYLILYTF